MNFAGKKNQEILFTNVAFISIYFLCMYSFYEWIVHMDTLMLIEAKKEKKYDNFFLKNMIKGQDLVLSRCTNIIFVI